MFILIDSTYLNVSNIVSFKKAKCGDTWRLTVETTNNEIKRFDTKQKETFDQWCCQLPIYACEKPKNDLEEQKAKLSKLEKAIEICKNKQVDFSVLKLAKEVEDYNYECPFTEGLLTEEEFNLLKEVFGNERV